MLISQLLQCKQSLFCWKTSRECKTTDRMQQYVSATCSFATWILPCWIGCVAFFAEFSKKERLLAVYDQAICIAKFVWFPRCLPLLDSHHLNSQSQLSQQTCLWTFCNSLKCHPSSHPNLPGRGVVAPFRWVWARRQMTFQTFFVRACLERWHVSSVVLIDSHQGGH